MIETLLFIAVAIVLLVVYLLWKYVNGLEARLSEKYKRSLERAKKTLSEKRKAR